MFVTHFSASSLSHLTLTIPQKKETEVEEAEPSVEQEELVQTPLSPMLQETENAADDFEYQGRVLDVKDV